MREFYRSLHQEWVKIQKMYASDPFNSEVMDNSSKIIRRFRKPLVERYFDTVSEYSE